MKLFVSGVRPGSLLLLGTCLQVFTLPAIAEQTLSPPAVAPPVPSTGTIRGLRVTGNQRLEVETVLSYAKLKVGDPYSGERLDQALRDLYATELFADVQLRVAAGEIIVEVRESPLVNRVLLEGNKRLKDDKIRPEIRLSPRQIFTRSKVRADVARIIELYRRQGRFAAQVEPKIIQLDQNRVDLVFEINEGPKSVVRQINILGNEKFSDGELRAEMVTRQSRLLSFLSSGTTYDPDRMAFDQQKLRQFYLTNGYADFRVISAVAELTPDRRDFILTYVVEEGERYRFGSVGIDSEIRDLKPEALRGVLPMKAGDWYNAKQIEDTVTRLNETAGLFGYAFADARPNFERDKDQRTMSVTFKVDSAPRVYVERVDINGNTQTRDKIIRREFRLLEGDAFNSIRVKRSQDRIKSLGYFQDSFEIQQQPGATPDRVQLIANVQEKSTGELQVSGGYSSEEGAIANLSIRQRNFMGKGQELRASGSISGTATSVELGFTEPYLFDRNIAVGVDLYRRDYNSYNYIGEERNTTYEQVTTGAQLRAGLPLSEYLSLALRYSLNHDDVSLDRASFYSDPDGDGVASCDPLLASRYLCDAIGARLTSSVGYSLVYDTLNNRLTPTAGERVTLSQDFAGIGGDSRYARTRLVGAKYWGLGSGFILSASVEGGYIHSFEDGGEEGEDTVRLTDRFFLGQPQLRGFDIRGVGPRVRRIPYNSDGTLVTDESQITEDALGGRAYYLGRAELQIPLGAKVKELGIRPSVYLDVGAAFGLKDPATLDLKPGDPALIRNTLTDEGLRQCSDNASGTISTIGTDASACPEGTTIVATSLSPFKEVYVGDTPKPRLSIGFGVNWNSPMGPFRIDVAKALLKAEGDDTKLFTFSVGTAF